MDTEEFENDLIQSLIHKIEAGCISQEELVVLECYWNAETVKNFCNFSKKNPKNHTFICNSLQGFSFTIIEIDGRESKKFMIEKNSKDNFYCSNCKLIRTNLPAVTPAYITLNK